MEKENPKNLMEEKTFTYLALGDSYTIGEGVDEKDRYPNQTVDLLKVKGLEFEKPTIIAKTGWTTDELVKGIVHAEIEGNTYDLVTLLIGVNNQYRGRPLENYESEFRTLLQDAITYAKGNSNRVVVISIPDWGVTPFAVNRGSDQEKVAKEIDEFNASKKSIANQLGVHYIDITEEYREIGALPQMVVSDNLHPSALVYEKWAQKLEKVIFEKMAF
ncbi:SGNH/GDSL hydrolase family protein [Aquiflexum lacus]|uniref:SGNH/GDSL hydrolase family protein n=1 Tax=Aquiflexum lacus TaxID=2483805 RepID=UPI001E5EBCE3|nr:SGNH/GDSL hydrolase family protein [Aquiflexum lacus]